MSNHSVTCKVCLKNAVISVWGVSGGGDGGVYVWRCVGGVKGCEGVSVGVY